jgi:Fe-S cluster biogenesis protein NfuA
MMAFREGVETALARIRPHLQADGGDIELVDARGGDATVRLTGICASCPMSPMTLHFGVEAALREHVEGFATLHIARSEGDGAPPSPVVPRHGPPR